MKNPLLLTLTLTALLALSAVAQPVPVAYQFTSLYTNTLANNSLLPGTTNESAVLDASKTTVLSLNAELTGVAAAYNTWTLTNAPTSSNAQVFALFVDTNRYGYVWTNVDGLTTGIPTSYVTNYTLTVTNGSAGTMGNTLSVIYRGPTTNIYTFTNAPTASTDIDTGTNLSALELTTNIYTRLSADFRSVTWSLTSSNVIAFSVTTNDQFRLAYTSTSNFTYAATMAATATNTVSTNLYYIVAGTNVQTSTTNLYNVLRRDHPYLWPVYTASNALKIWTTDTRALTVTNSASLATSTMTTNAAYGTVYGTASNSLNGTSWFRAAAYDWTLPLSTTTAVGCISNFTGLGAQGYLKWSVGTATTNGGATLFKFGAAVKNGL